MRAFLVRLGLIEPRIILANVNVVDIDWLQKTLGDGYIVVPMGLGSESNIFSNIGTL